MYQRMKTIARIATGVAFVFVPSIVSAQNFTSVSGTITDPNGIPYANCNITAELVPTGNNPTIGGAAIGGLNRASCDGNGTFSMTLGSNTVIQPGGTQWKFTVTETGAPPPIGTGPQSFVVTSTITGATQSLTTTLSAAAPSLSRGASSSASVGPVFNARQFGASSLLADNNAAFTATVAASNAAKSAGVPAALRQPSTVGQNGTVTSLTINAAILGGDTACAFVFDSVARAFTITTDVGNTTFTQVGTATNSSGGGFIQTFCTAAGGANQANQVIATQGGAAEFMSMTVVSVPNVSAIVAGTPSVGSSSAPAFSQTTSLPNSMIVSACGWWNNAAISLSANAGNLQANQSAAVGILGLASWATFQAAVGSVTNSGTLSATAFWACQGVEMKGGGTTSAMPTVYFPGGQGVVYFYSGGISLTIPSNFECQRGTTLFYTGSAHAIDVGPPGLTGPTQQFPYFFKGCTMSGGLNATQGIFINPFITKVGFSEMFFLNFGPRYAGAANPLTGWMVAGTNDNWDVEFGAQTRFETNDFTPRLGVRLNLNNVNLNSFLRVHDINFFCLEGPGPGNTGGCTAAHAGIGIWFDGANNGLYNSNLAFLAPAVVLGCSGGLNCTGDVLDNNQLETAVSGAVTPIIQFQSGVDRALIHNSHSMNTHSSGVSPVGPRSVSDVITGLRMNFNSINNTADATPVVALNNIAGQVGNQSSNNICTILLASPHVCPTPHTTGANILPWSFNVDDALTLSNPLTVATLPSAAANPGSMIRVSDSTAIAAEGQTCVGGSTNTALAFSNGTVWKCF